MEELNKGYEFTRAQIAELESLRAWKAEIEKQEPVAWWNGKETAFFEHETDGPVGEVCIPLYTTPAISPDVDKVPANKLREMQEENQSLKAELAKATSELEAARKDSEWISVDDRLPERYTEVMVWPHPSEQVMTAQFGLTHKESATEWHYSEYISGFGWEEQICNPTHWKPLPAPPASDQANGARE